MSQDLIDQLRTGHPLDIDGSAAADLIERQAAQIADLESDLATAKNGNAHFASHIANLAAQIAELQRNARRVEWIEENARSEGGGNGFTVFVPVDHEDMGCGIDAAIISLTSTK